MGQTAPIEERHEQRGKRSQAGIKSLQGVLRTQTVTLTSGSAQQEEKREVEAQHTQVQTRAQRAHWRLSWHERMARNARLSTASPLEVTIHGLPAAFAQSFGLNVVTAA